MTLTDKISGQPLDGSQTFRLSPGITYELTADLVLGARVDPVPEPATVTLLGLGALALLGYGSRRPRSVSDLSGAAGVTSSGRSPGRLHRQAWTEPRRWASAPGAWVRGWARM
jgi:hypothetical protein